MVQPCGARRRNGASLILAYGAYGAADDHPLRCEAGFPGLVAWLQELYDRRGPGPKDGPWLCFADFAGNQRSYANLVASHAVPLDLDLGAYAWDADSIRARLAGYQFTAWTSYSHTPERPRWRIVVPVDQPMSRAQHYATWETLAALFLNDAGQSSKDATRLNYLPGTCLHPEHAQFITGAGAVFPVSPVPVGTEHHGVTDDLTTEPVPGWAGPEDDEQLLQYMLTNRRAAEDAFGGGPTRFEALWTADAAALAVKYPPIEDDQLFEHTRADAGLANELAFYTGSHGVRMLDLFMRSALAQRDRFREDKARRACLLACERDAKQHAFMRPTIAAPSITVTMDPASPTTAADSTEGAGSAISNAADFFAYLPDHTYIHRPTGGRWPAASLDGTVGKDTRMMLDLTHPVHLLSWAPGLPERFQMRDLDVSNERAADAWVYNEYHAPSAARHDGDIAPWLELLHKLYPGADAEHILRYMADAVQNPGRKCNHALVLGSGIHGIGKDTLLKPLRRGVGERNYMVIEPRALFADFNPWVAAVVVQISESRNIGDGDGGRISKYDIESKVKNLAAAPPTTLERNAKYVSQQQVKNVLRLIITTNHGIDGIYVTSEDRRHYCAWSNAPAMSADEGDRLHKWLDGGGCESVMHYLAAFDLSAWNPGAPPPHTEWWHRLVLEGNAQDDNPLPDAIARLGSPAWVSVESLTKAGGPELASWFADVRNRKHAPRFFGALGYNRLRNPSDGRGRFKINGQQQIVYAKTGVEPASVR